MKYFDPNEPLEFSLTSDIKVSSVDTSDRIPQGKKEELEKEDLKLPSKSKMAFNFFNSVKNFGKDLLDGKEVLAKKNITEKRLEVCLDCPKLMKDEGRCSLCGCYIKAKARMMQESCPIGKW
tara:strand:- start:542 stop:907 length:366 start_codon:yes stop_codon:yes gene_type:complete